MVNFSEVRMAQFQIHSPHLLFGAPGIFSGILGFFPDAKERVGCRKQREATAPIHQLSYRGAYTDLRSSLGQNTDMMIITQIK